MEIFSSTEKDLIKSAKDLLDSPVYTLGQVRNFFKDKASSLFIKKVLFCLALINNWNLVVYQLKGDTDSVYFDIIPDRIHGGPYEIERMFLPIDPKTHRREELNKDVNYWKDKFKFYYSRALPSEFLDKLLTNLKFLEE